MHNVEQTPPNGRKKSTGDGLGDGVGTGAAPTGYAPDATGKCSTCSGTFSNAQEFYEHLDECVLRIVQQGDPAEAINERHMASMDSDVAVAETLRGHALSGGEGESISPPLPSAGAVPTGTVPENHEAGNGDEAAAEAPEAWDGGADAHASANAPAASRSGRGMLRRPSHPQ